MQDREFTQICKEILALSEKIKELNLARLETISVEIKLAKNSFDNKSGEMDAKIAEFNAVAQRLEPLKQSLAKAEEILAKIKENGGAGVSEEKAKQLINEALDGLTSTVEELKQKTPIDDATTATNTTFSSRKIEDTFAKKSEAADVSTLATKEELNAKIGETKANELITAKTANLANKTELNAKLDAATYNSEKANYATKTEVTNALQNKADATALQSAVTSLQSEITTKISQAASGGVTRDYVKNFTKAVSVSSATIYFSSGINFYLDNPSGGPVLKAGDLGNPDNFGKSGLVYINGTSIQSLAPDFVPINPDEATFSKGYVFFSYFFHPVQRKIIVQYLKDSTI
nr:hypothetical protein [uncultured Campylobacter sp.]